MWLLAIVSFVVECMWLSAIVPFYLLQILETSPCRGGAAKIFNFSLNSLHFYLITHVQSLLFFAASIGGGIEPCQRVAGIARRAIPTWTVAGIAVAVSRLRSRFLY